MSTTQAPVATFYAVTTRDHEAQARDGQPVYEYRPVRVTRDEAIYEVRFADGEWMLADLRDLDI